LTGNSSVPLSASHWLRALVWQCGQCRDRHELKGMASRPQWQQQSWCPPRPPYGSARSRTIRASVATSTRIDSFDQALAMRTDDVGHPEPRWFHRLSNLRDRFTWSGLDSFALPKRRARAFRYGVGTHEGRSTSASDLPGPTVLGPSVDRHRLPTSVWRNCALEGRRTAFAMPARCAASRHAPGGRFERDRLVCP
jgi:hypothetical protein